MIETPAFGAAAAPAGSSSDDEAISRADRGIRKDNSGGRCKSRTVASLRVVVHLRIVAPSDKVGEGARAAVRPRSVCNVIFLKGAARRPDGDVILCDVAREDASVILGDLRELEIPRDGSIAMEYIDTQISEAADRAEKFAPGAPSDAVVWEQVEASTSENVELSGNFIAFMVLAVLIATAGIFLDSPILIIGAMVVGPEFGPLAGLCVALVEKRGKLALRSLKALAVGFPVAITAGFLVSVAIKELGLAPDGFSLDGRAVHRVHHPSGLLLVLRRLPGRAAPACCR